MPYNFIFSALFCVLDALLSKFIVKSNTFWRLFSLIEVFRVQVYCNLKPVLEAFFFREVFGVAVYCEVKEHFSSREDQAVGFVFSCSSLL